MPQLNRPCKPQGAGPDGKQNIPSYHQHDVNVLHSGTAGKTPTLLSLTKESWRSLNAGAKLRSGKMMARHTASAHECSPDPRAQLRERR